MTPADPLHRVLARQGYVVLDGGLATALEERGLTLDTALWSARVLLDDPDQIRAVHRAYLEAGADCITTASYQASFEGFAAAGLAAAEAEALLLRSVRLAVEERDSFWSGGSGRRGRVRPLVAASVGPYGAYLADGSEYVGRYDVGPPELDAFHRRRLRILADSGADVIACETIPSAAEADVLVRILEEVSPARAWMSFTCGDGRALRDGTPIREVAARCSASEAVVAIGVNCTAPEHVEELLTEVGEATDRPRVAYPNSGETYDGVAKRWSGGGAPPAWSRGVDAWWRAGARIVGGCCRVGPAAIAAVRRRLEALAALDTGGRGA